MRVDTMFGAVLARCREAGRAVGAFTCYDLLGFEWTLLCLNEASALGAPDLKIVHLADNAVRDAYQADYALIRPDQIVAWRGNDARAALTALDTLRG